MSRNALLAVVTASALLGALVALAVVHVRAPARDEPREGTAATCACAGASATTAAAGSAAAPVPLPAAPPAHELARFAVCEREETRAALAQVILVRGRPLWSLHCGRSVHLIAIEALADSLVPQRVAVVRATSASPAETAIALEPAAADIDGDGRADWIVPATFVDATGVPRGGGVYVLPQRAEGGFDAPRRLLAAAPGGVVTAQLDAEPADDLVVLHRADASTGRADELWLMTGGPSPLRIAQRPAAVATRAIAALDLDLDRRDDLAAASSDESRVLLWLSGTGALGQAAPAELALPHIERLLSADIDRDGTRELVLAGERAWRLSTPLSAPPAPLAIEGSEGLRDLHVADTDGDGAPELVGYAHPDVVALRPKAGRFERTRVCSLRGEAPVLFARVAQLDGDPRPDLIAITLAAGTGRHVELSVERNLEPAAIVQLPERSMPLADAALAQQFTVP